MAIAVHGHLVARLDDRARHIRVRVDLLADQEERRGRASSREHLERRGRALGMRAVVERQRDDITVDPPLDPVRARERRDVRGEEPHASASTSDAADGSVASASPGSGRDPSAARSARASSRCVRTTSAIP